MTEAAIDRSYPLQPWEYLVGMVDSPGWKVLKQDFEEELKRRLNQLLDKDGEVDARLKGEVKMLKWVIERPYTLVQEARDHVAREAENQQAQARADHYTEYGRGSPIPPPSVTQTVARPEIE
jgi:hypothetical protein